MDGRRQSLSFGRRLSSAVLRLSSTDEVTSERQRRRLRAVGHAQLGQDVADVKAHCPFADGQAVGDFMVGQPTGDLMARSTNDVREVNLMFNPGLNLVIGSANFLFMPLIAAPSIFPQLVLVPILCWIIVSSPLNAPPQMKRMLVVSIWMYCCSGCLRPP